MAKPKRTAAKRPTKEELNPPMERDAPTQAELEKRQEIDERTAAAPAKKFRMPLASKAEDYAKAPFTEEQIENIEEYQASGLGHGIPCPNRHSEVMNDKFGAMAMLEPKEEGLVCGLCGYTQEVVPMIVASGAAYKALKGAHERHRTALSKK